MSVYVTRYFQAINTAQAQVVALKMEREQFKLDVLGQSEKGMCDLRLKHDEEVLSLKRQNDSMTLQQADLTKKVIALPGVFMF